MIYTKTFPSGLRLVAQEMPHLYTVSVGVYVNIGCEKETTDTNGYSHFIEHLMFKGTEKRSCTQISEDMENIGAQFNAFTSKDNTCYYTKSASKYIETCLDLLADMYFNSTFDSKELEKEKSVVIEEISMNDDHPDDICQDLISSAVYFEQPLGQTILGNTQNIKYCDRHSIIKFYNRHYIPQNTVISIAGKFDYSQLIELIEKYFETPYNSSKFIQTHKELTPVQAEIPTITTEFLHKIKDSEQSHICMAFEGSSMRNDLSTQYALMCSILGGGMSSRLFQTIREKHGLAYTTYAYSSTYLESGFVELYCATNPDNLNKLADLIKDVLIDFVQNGVTEQELSRAKALAENGIYMAIEDSLNVMMGNGRRMVKLNQPIEVESRIADIQNVTKEQIQQLASKVFCSPYAAAYVGKRSKGFDKFAKLKLN